MFKHEFETKMNNKQINKYKNVNKSNNTKNIQVCTVQ